MGKSLSALLLVGSLIFSVSFVFGSGPEQPSKPQPILTVGTERDTGVYSQGEKVTFVVELKQDNQFIQSGEVNWTITKNNVTQIRSGRSPLENGRSLIFGELNEPGFLDIKVTVRLGQHGLVARAAAAISPERIKPSTPAPADFGTFWATKKAALAAVPLNTHLTPMLSQSKKIENFDVQSDSIGVPVSGCYSRPVGGKPRSAPAILLTHGGGVRSATFTDPAYWASEGAIALEINAHGLPNGKEDAFYANLAQGTLADYRVRGRESRETIYFLGMILRLVRAIDFLTAQPEWDGRTVIVLGSSQGGMQAIAAAGIDSRVTFFGAGVPAACDHAGQLAGRSPVWPKFIAAGETQPPAAVLKAVKYYDSVNFAAQAKAEAFFTVGFLDTTCPPTSVYAAYNQLSGQKEIFHDITAEHTDTPAARSAMHAAVHRHIVMQRTTTSRETHDASKTPAPSTSSQTRQKR